MAVTVAWSRGTSLGLHPRTSLHMALSSTLSGQELSRGPPAHLRRVLMEQTEVPKAPRTYTERESWVCASHSLSQMTTPIVLQANLYVQENSHTINLLMTFIDPTAYL